MERPDTGRLHGVRSIFYKIYIQGRGCYVMSRGSELIREQLIRRVEEHLSEAVKAAQTAGLSAEELHQLLNLFMEERNDD